LNTSPLRFWLILLTDMDILSFVAAQLFFVLALVAIGGVVYFAYQAKYMQQQKSHSRNKREAEKKDRKPKKEPRHVEPEPERKEAAEESESEAEPESEPEPQKVMQKKKKKSEEKKEEKKAEEQKPQAKAAPAKKTTPKPPAVVLPPKQSVTNAKQKTPEEKRKEQPKAEEKAKKDKNERKKKLLQAEKEHQADLAAIQKKPAKEVKPQQDDAGWTESVNKATKRLLNKEEKKANGGSVKLTIPVKSRVISTLMSLKAKVLLKIQDLTDTKITVPKSRSGAFDQLFDITIEGNSKGCAYAQELVTEIAERGYSKETHPTWVTKQFTLENRAREWPLLCGPNGETVKKLQEKMNVRIKLPAGSKGEQKNADESIVTVVGDEVDCNRALDAIQMLLKEGYSRLLSPTFIRGEVSVRVSQISALIGKHGVKVEQIRQQTGVERIIIPRVEKSIPRNDAAIGDMATVSVIGTKSAVNAAIAMISSEFSADPTMPVMVDPTSPWATNNVQENDW